MIPARRLSLVYVLDADHGTKIGMSASSTSTRLASIQSGCGMSFRLVRSFTFVTRAEAYRVEQLAHYLLRDDRHTGEWFWCHPLEAVAAVERAILLPTSAREVRILAKWTPRIAALLSEESAA